MELLLPINEPARLMSLRGIKILDTPTEPAYDDLTQLAADLCGTPTAMISLVDSDRQWFKSVVGSTLTETLRSDSVCQYTIMEPSRSLCIPDLSMDERTKEFWYVKQAPHFRSYAGVTLILSDGHAVGTLCVLDAKPHDFTAAQVNGLHTLGRAIVAELEKRIYSVNLTLANNRFCRLAANCPGLIFQSTVDSQTATVHMHYASASSAAMLGFTPEQLCAIPNIFSSLCHPDDLPSLTRSRRGLVRTTEMSCWEGRLITPHRGVRWVRLQSQPARLEEGNYVVDGLVQDITEFKNAEGALRLSRIEAEKATAAKSQFLASMSHELRTPLNGVIGMTALLHDMNLPPEAQQYVGLARTSADMLFALINDILDFSKIEAGRMELAPVDFDLHQLVRDVGAIAGLRAEEQQIELVTTVDPQVARYHHGDPDRLRQILLNLASNAVKFTTKGSVTIKLMLDPREDRQIVLAVTDTGIGIPQERLDRLFKPFSQVDASTTRRYGGTGLGLVIARDLAVLMGGGISVSSIVGQGSVFEVRLPLVPAQQPATLDPELPNTPLRADLHVLIAEDNEINQMLIEALLTKMGVQATIVDNGQKALMALENNAFDLVLMDCQMPVMDGLTAAQRLREREQREGSTRTPVIAVTANAISGDREVCLAAGMDDYLAKPINPQLLREMIARWSRVRALAAVG
jgi:signal transduction histidine kinase/ActR/RegA family two-component response regulator